MVEQSDEDAENEKALSDYQEGIRLGCGVRASAGMRRLGCLDGANLELLVQMFGQDPDLSDLFSYHFRFLKVNSGSESNALPANLNPSLKAAIAAGDVTAVSEALKDISKLGGSELSLVAKLVEDKEPFLSYSLRFAQRRTGPPVDELAMKANWFKINRAYNQAQEKTGYAKVAVGEVMDLFSVGRSTVYKAIKYFAKIRID